MEKMQEKNQIDSAGLYSICTNLKATGATQLDPFCNFVGHVTVGEP